MTIQYTEHIFKNCPYIFYEKSLSTCPANAPAVLYFATSHEESLNVDPFCQPVNILIQNNIRVFSCDLPGHGINHDSRKALATWTTSWRNNQDPLLDLFTYTTEFIKQLQCPVGLMGLSRGGFIATNIAKACVKANKKVQGLVLFAPVTTLSILEEFTNCPLPEYENLTVGIECLLDIPTKVYIGNNDTKVSTSHCMHFLEKLVYAHHASGKRTAPVEWNVTVSIGAWGHGTPKESFEHGAQWLSNKLYMI